MVHRLAGHFPERLKAWHLQLSKVPSPGWKGAETFAQLDELLVTLGASAGRS
jgi:hypothetical protein